jgi:signal transduction histidine kinase
VSVDLDDLRRIDLFDGLDDALLERWAEACEVRTFKPGEYVLRMNDRPVPFKLLLEGKLDGLVMVDGREEVETSQVAPTWIGAMLALSGDPSPLALRVAEPARLAFIQSDAFKRLLFDSPPAFDRVIHVFRAIFTRFEGAELQREKLAALGRMSAGLAHELNNPAAAALRSAGALGDALEALGGVVAGFVESGVERAEAEQLVALHREALRRAADPAPVDALAAADAEDAMLDLLERHGVEEPWRHAEPLSAAGLDCDWLEEVAALAGPALPTAVAWVSSSITARSLAEELRESTQRMSTLVCAIKDYSYMDRAALQEVDVHDGIDSTLTVLGHKLKHTAIEVVRHYGADVPRICVYGSELNQVWTNLLENAIDALGERGRIEVSTAPWRDRGVEVRVSDDGPGIPADAQRRIFEPFYTTKAVGAGTGLGLDTSRRIVVDRHQGDLRVASEPGATTFTVRLPREPRTAG